MRWTYGAELTPAELTSPFVRLAAPEGAAASDGQGEDSWTTEWEAQESESGWESEWAWEDSPWVMEPEGSGARSGEGEGTSGTVRAPRNIGVPFAPGPPEVAYFPVRSTHPRAAEINYVAEDGTPVGANTARRFGAPRNGGARHHCAIDVYARRGDEVVACEEGRLLAFYGFCCGSPPTSWALLVEHADKVVNYGEVAPDSLRRLGLSLGQSVSAGQTIAYVGVNPGGSSMLHFETYAPGIRRNLRWPGNTPAPRGLLDPTRYLLRLLPTLSAPRATTGASPASLSTPTPRSPARAAARPVLRRGSRGPAVRRLQEALTRAGFPTSVDGDFGRLTEAAVRAIQSARGLSVDGVVGSQTWAALEAAPPGGTGDDSRLPATDAAVAPALAVPPTMPTERLGILHAELPGRAPFDYQLTPEDLIWSAKLLVHEAGGEDDVENRAVLWSMLNRYALFTHGSYPTFTAFIRAYSTTLQPVLRSRQAAERHYCKGDAVFRRTGGYYPGSQVPRGQLVRHLQIQAARWDQVKASARSLATRVLRGEVPNPGIGLASEFASTWVFYRQRHGVSPTREQWEQYTRDLARRRNLVWVPLPGVAPQSNVFFVQQRVADLPAGTVAIRIADSTEFEAVDHFSGESPWQEGDGTDDEEAWAMRAEAADPRCPCCLRS